VVIYEPGVNHSASVRLARAFGPAMRAAASQAPVGSPLLAWVNLLADGALSSSRRDSLPASSAAADSFSQSLRAEMRPAGIRVLNMFAPLTPTLAPEALASAVVKDLQEGIEDVYPGGELPEGWLARWCNIS
jgi:NAD(P)-dependent dehydrogenase (short-subunit alcohol dehydrogenase family)